MSFGVWSSTLHRLSWIEIWKIWRPRQHLEPFVMFLKLFLKHFCSVHYPAEKKPLKGCTWSATIFRQAVYVKVTSALMPGPKVSQQNIAQVFFHKMHLAAISKQHTCTLPSTWSKRVRVQMLLSIHCSIIQFWCSHANCKCFWRWTGSSWHSDWCRKKVEKLSLRHTFSKCTLLYILGNNVHTLVTNM